MNPINEKKVYLLTDLNLIGASERDDLMDVSGSFFLCSSLYSSTQTLQKFQKKLPTTTDTEIRVLQLCRLTATASVPKKFENRAR